MRVVVVVSINSSNKYYIDNESSIFESNIQNVYYPQALSSSFSLGSSPEFWKKIFLFVSNQKKKKDEQNGRTGWVRE